MDDREDGSRRAGNAPTIKDVAALAGVSWRTVTNVVHGHRYLSESTKAKVETAIAELGYRPRMAARQLRSGRSNLLTLAVPYIAHPYFAQLAHAVVQEAGRVGYDVLIDETRARPERELDVAAGYRKILTDGTIFSPIVISQERLEAADVRRPIVLLGEHIQSDRVDSVVVDNVRSFRELVEHLVELGRRRIAFLGHVRDGELGSADLRLRGYRKGLEAAGIDPDPALLVAVTHGPEASESEGDYSRDEGYVRAQQLLPKIGTIDAVVCGNDLLAIGTLRAFREAGVRVPDDVAVTGWDGTQEGAFAAPALTTVAPDLDGIAQLAVQAVLGRLDRPDVAPSASIAGHTLVPRESTLGRAG